LLASVTTAAADDDTDDDEVTWSDDVIALWAGRQNARFNNEDPRKEGDDGKRTSSNS